MKSNLTLVDSTREKAEEIISDGIETIYARPQPHSKSVALGIAGDYGFSSLNIGVEMWPVVRDKLEAVFVKAGMRIDQKENSGES